MDESTLSIYDDYEYRKGEANSEGLFSPFTFLCFALVVFFLGSLILYSSSFYNAISSGEAHYAFFSNQMIGAAGGLAFGILLCLIPDARLKKIYYITIFVSVSLGLMHLLVPEVIVSYGLATFVSLLALVSIVLYLSDSVVRTLNSERIGLSFLISCILVLTLSVMAGLVGGMGWFLVCAMITLAALSFQGMKKGMLLWGGVLFLVTAVFLILVFPKASKDFFSILFPVEESTLGDKDVALASLAIKGGGVFGCGLGKGIFKLGFIARPYGEMVFATLAEETGIFGSALLLFSLLIVFVIGLRTANRARRKGDSFIASMSIGYTLIMVFCSLGNILRTLGLNPFSGLQLPLFSYGPFDEALYMIILCFLYKYIHKMGRGDEKEK